MAQMNDGPTDEESRQERAVMSDFEWTAHEYDGDHCLACNVGDYRACIWYVSPEHLRVYYCDIRGRARTLVFDGLKTIDEAKAKLESELRVLRQRD